MTMVRLGFAASLLALASTDAVAGEKEQDTHLVTSDSNNIKLYGAINRAGLWLDNGPHSNLAHVDNNNDYSHFGVLASADLSEATKIGGEFELAFEQNSSLINDVHDAASTERSEREMRVYKAEVFVNSNKYGNLRLGRGEMAAYGTMEETDLSGTRVIANGSNIWRMAGGASFFDKTNQTNGQYFISREYTFGGVFANAQGFDRRDRVRYDSPKYYGFRVSGSHGYQSSGDLFDLAFRFAGKYYGVKLVADVAYENDHSVVNFHYWQVNGSAGVLVPYSSSMKSDCGINLHFGTAYRHWDFPGQSAGHFYSGKVGYIDRYVSFGNTAFAVDAAWSKGMTLAANNAFDAINPNFTNKGTSWGVSLVQNIDAVASQVYLGYRNYQFKKENSGLRFDDINAVMGGIRVQM